MAIYNNDRDPNISIMKEKWQVRVFWGEDLVRKLESYDNEELIECDIDKEEWEYDGCDKWYTFDTEAERNAFLLGINEADGWWGMRYVIPEDINEQIN